MTVEDHVREAIIEELKRQSDVAGGRLKVNADDPVRVVIEGPVDLDELVMSIMGSLAGGP